MLRDSVADAPAAKDVIMATVIFETSQWAQENFGRCELGNQRRNKRIVKVATQMANKPEASLPNQMETWGDLKAAYRLFNAADVRFQEIIAPHCQKTRESCKAGEIKLVVCDTSEFDFSSLSKARGLGPIGNGSGRGFFLHSAMMIDAVTHRVDGIAAAEKFYRRERKGPKAARNTQRRRTDRESVVWGNTIDRVGSPPPGVTWIHVCDRGADDIEVMWRARSQNCGFIIRASHLTRKIITPEGIEQPLKDYLETLPQHGTREIEVRATTKAPARTATVTLRYGRIDIPLSAVLTPWLKENRPSAPLPVGVVELLEMNPPKGVKPIRWVLYTHTPVCQDSDAETIIQYYEQRPKVEDYHKALKTGCSVEQRRLITAHGLENVLALSIIIAVRLLQLKSAALENPDRPAREYVPLSWIQMLRKIRNLPSVIELTIRDFVRQLAGLGGFLGRKRDGEPGWITVWRGFEKLILMLRGAAISRMRSG